MRRVLASLVMAAVIAVGVVGLMLMTDTPTPAPAAPALTFGDGVYLVGQDIPAGRWTLIHPGPICLVGIVAPGTEVPQFIDVRRPTTINLASGALISADQCGTWRED